MKVFYVFSYLHQKQGNMHMRQRHYCRPSQRLWWFWFCIQQVGKSERNVHMDEWVKVISKDDNVLSYVEVESILIESCMHRLLIDKNINMMMSLWVDSIDNEIMDVCFNWCALFYHKYWSLCVWRRWIVVSYKIYRH